MIKGCSAVTLNSIKAECEKSSGGIKRILIAQRSDVTVTISNSDNTYNEITDIKNAVGTKFVEWTFRPETGSYTSTLTTDYKTGNQSWSTVVSLQFTRVEAEKRMYIQSALNAAAVVIVEDFNGSKIYLGYDEPVYGTNGTMVSGTAREDLNGFTVEFTDKSAEMPHFISDDFDIDNLLNAGA